MAEALAKIKPESRLDESITVSGLTATHPKYDQYLADWIRYLDLYEGENLERYIFKHDRESTRSWNARKKRIVYRNFCAPVVDLYLHYIFSKAITRAASRAAHEKLQAEKEQQREEQNEQRTKGAKVLPFRRPAASGTGGSSAAEWEAWQKDVDRRRTPIDRFMVDAERWALVFGHAFVLMDLPSTKNKPRNEEERKQMALRPYASLYFPTEAINWDLDEDLRLEWIRFREPTSGGSNPFGPDKAPQYGGARLVTSADQDPNRRASSALYREQVVNDVQYRTFTRKGWYLHEIKGNQVFTVDEGVYPAGFNQVPVVPIYNRRSSRYPFVGVSLLSDIARLNIEILNIDSLIQEGVYQQTLNILTMGKQQGNQKEITLSEQNVLEYTGQPPYFLSPSTAPISFMEDRIQRMREEISRIAKLGGGLGLEPRGSQSGIALAYEFNETNAVLAEKANEIEMGETAMHEAWFKWMGAEWQGIVDYPNEFSVQSFQEEIDLVTKAGDAMRSPTARKEMEKRALKKILHNVNDEIRDQIEFEIDFIPESVKTFSGPIFFDPIKQQWNTPGAGNPPIGVLGELLGAAPPDDEKSNPQPEPEMPMDGGFPPGTGQPGAQQGKPGAPTKGASKPPGTEKKVA